LLGEGLATGAPIVADDPQVLTEEFDFLGLSTVRFWFKDIDLLDKNNTAPLKKSNIAKQTERDNDRLMQGLYGGSAFKLTLEMKLCVRLAFRLFYKDRDFLKRIQDDVEAGPDHYFSTYPKSVHGDLNEALAEIKRVYGSKDRIKKDNYRQLERDQWMADKGHWRHWEGKRIAIALDKNKVLMHWFFAEAVQVMCPPGTLAKMDKAIKDYAWLNPITKAGTRFDANADFHLVNNPQHDLKRLEAVDPPDPLAVHSAVCGVEHMGAHNEQGSYKIVRQEMHQNRFFENLVDEEHGNEHYGWTQFKYLQYGAMGIGTKISRFFLELLDPDLFKEYTSSTENTPEEFRVDTVRGTNGKDCFSYRALNFNTHTEDHTDSSDYKYGLAGLQIGGDFNGGDLILRETRQMFEFLPGSQGFVRGSLQRHCTRAWFGKSRYCQVLTVNERVYSVYPPEKRLNDKTKYRLPAKSGDKTAGKPKHDTDDDDDSPDDSEEPESGSSAKVKKSAAKKPATKKATKKPATKKAAKSPAMKKAAKKPAAKKAKGSAAKVSSTATAHGDQKGTSRVSKP
jgi:hypothetical protein